MWNGYSTKLIRKICPDSTIICLDPRPIPSNGFKDTNTKTKYYLGNNFKDFKQLDLSSYKSNEILCFFDCHQNAYERLKQCMEKKIVNVFFNDNYHVNCGSHFTIEHLLEDDSRNDTVTKEKKEILNYIETYHVFPNIFPGKIKTGEGLFDCESYFKSNCSKDNIFYIFEKERCYYRWNTYIKLK